MLWWIVLGYLGFGLLLMDYMCPAWPSFEKLAGAVIWPISAGIGIYVFVTEDGDGVATNHEGKVAE